MSPSRNSRAAVVAFPAELVEAGRHRAEHDAERVIRFLNPLLERIAHRTDQFGTVDDLKKSFPTWFLLELAAALQVQEWERLQCLPAEHDLPPSSQLFDELLARLPLSGQTAHIHQRIWHFACHHFSWQASAEASAELLLDELHDDDLVNALADFLWENRND